MQENYTIPAEFTLVSDLSALATSGSRSSVLFFKDDTIEIGDKVYSMVRTDKSGAVVKNAKTGEPVMVYYIVVSINGGQPRPIPFGSFRRFPREVDDFLQKSDLMRNLYSGSDLDRFNLLKGRTIKVTSLEEGEAIDWKQSDADTGTYVFKKAKFAVFAYKQ